MSLGLQLILSTTLVTTPPGCPWTHPGANPYRGDRVAALADFGLTGEQRRQLATLLRAHRPTDVVTITRDDIVSRSGPQGYTDLREMHSGGGQVCHGQVDRSAWAAGRRERALVYCAGDACVIVPDICHNISLVSRRPDRESALDETPIDIEPAAGPRPTPAPQDASSPESEGPLAFFPTPENGGEAAVPAPADGGGGGGGGGGDGGGSGGGGGDGAGSAGPPIAGGGVPIGGPPCCVGGPAVPGPVTPPVSPLPAVPEPSNALLLLAGLAIAGWRARARGRA